MVPCIETIFNDFKDFLYTSWIPSPWGKNVLRKSHFYEKKVTFLVQNVCWSQNHFFFRGQVTFSKSTTFLVFLEKDAQRKTVQYDVLNNSQSLF